MLIGLVCHLLCVALLFSKESVAARTRPRTFAVAGAQRGDTSGSQGNNTSGYEGDVTYGGQGYNPAPLSRRGADNRRPIWNIAHMVNALYQVDLYLDWGANSLEFDVAFDTDGAAEFTFHGIPCDCFRTCTRYEEFMKFLNYLRDITTPGNAGFRKELVLLFFDLKVSGLNKGAQFKAGRDIALKLLDHYWQRGTSGAAAYILFSLPSTSTIEVLKGFRSTLKEENAMEYEDKIGYDVSGNEDLDEIKKVMDEGGVSKHVFLGDGITNCLPRSISRLVKAIDHRDQSKSSFIDKVYWWTVDKESTMKRTLSLGVDGMITNYPQRLVSVLAEDDYSKEFRLANINDIPWEKHPARSSSMTNLFSRSRSGSVTDFEETEELLYNS